MQSFWKALAAGLVIWFAIHLILPSRHDDQPPQDTQTTINNLRHQDPATVDRVYDRLYPDK